MVFTPGEVEPSLSPGGWGVGVGGSMGCSAYLVSKAWLALAYVIPSVGYMLARLYCTKEYQVCLFMLGGLVVWALQEPRQV